MLNDQQHNEFLVKGSAIESKLEYVRERFGSEPSGELRAQLEEEKIPLIFAAAWYPFEVYDKLNLFIAERFFGGNLKRLVEVGEFSAHHALTGTYAAYARNKDFVQFLDRLSTLHEQLYSLGKMTVSLGQDKLSCQIVLAGAPLYSESDLNVCEGFYLGAARLLGLEEITATRKLEDGRAVFELRWQ